MDNDTFHEIIAQLTLEDCFFLMNLIGTTYRGDLPPFEFADDLLYSVCLPSHSSLQVEHWRLSPFGLDFVQELQRRALLSYFALVRKVTPS